jgi:hypothetical protein
MLILKPNCEMCDRDLPPDCADACICSYECTFCTNCVGNVLHDVCPNCGGGFVPRPMRPARAHRPGTGLPHHPASAQRAKMKWTPAEVGALVAKLRDTPPSAR